MGAGAGYTVTVENTTVGNISIDNVELQKDTSGKEFFHWCNVDVNGTIEITGDVKIASYYDGCNFVEDVPMICTHCNIDLDIGSGYNDQILTAEAIEKYEAQFGIPVNDMYKELIEVIELQDINPEYIKECIRDSSFDGEARMGGGWVGSTFEGKIEDLDTSSNSGYGYQYVDSADLTITNKYVVDFLDKAKYGDNKEYTAIFNGEIFETYETEQAAIDELKTEINEAIAVGGPESVDFSDCYVEENYWQLLSAEGDSEWIDSFNPDNVIYTADGDADYEEYL